MFEELNKILDCKLFLKIYNKRYKWIDQVSFVERNPRFPTLSISVHNLAIFYSLIFSSFLLYPISQHFFFQHFLRHSTFERLRKFLEEVPTDSGSKQQKASGST